MTQAKAYSRLMPGGKSKRKNLHLVREEFFRANLTTTDGKRVSLREICDRLDVSYGSVRNKSAREGWKDDLQKVLTAQEESLKVRERVRDQVVRESLDQDSINQEFVVRTKHARWARAMAAKALSRLTRVKEEELKPREAIELLRLAIDEERRALGLQNVPILDVRVQEAVPGGWVSVTEHVAQQQRLRSLGVKLLEFLSDRQSADSPHNGVTIDAT